MTALARDAANAAFVGRLQVGLADRGFYTGDLDSWAAPGGATQRALETALGWKLPAGAPAPSARWPARGEASIRAYYGPPGESQLVRVDPPYPMRIAWDPDVPLRTITCHRLVADSLVEVLAAIHARLGAAGIRHHGLDLYGGCYNFRKMRGGASWSTHAWGIAIDLDPARNGLRTPWPAEAAMPVEAIELFEAAGWTSLARAIGRDAMHFQATSW